MKNLWTIAWALALALLLAEAGAAQDKAADGVVGTETFSTSTPGGGGELVSQGLDGERTAWFISHVAPGNPGVVNVVVTYYDSKESRDKAREKEKEKEKEKKKKADKKKDGKEPDRPPVPTYDPRFYDYKDGKLVPKTQNSIEGMVVPDNIHDRQPFSFAVPQITGEVVNVQTVEGVVVQQASTDKYGRIFLAAGLPAGAYLVSGSGHDQPLGKIEIRQRAGDALQHTPQSLQLQNPPEALKVSDGFTLNGTGLNSDYRKVKVRLTGSGQTEEPTILAATEDQLKLAPVQQLQPGAAQLRVTNQDTGESTDATRVLLYDIQGRLERRTLKSGDQSELVVTVIPDDLPLTVKTNVVSGPVDFGGGRKQVEGVTNHGQAIFPVRAEHGSGPFQLTWELAPNQDFVTHDECRCNINIGRCQPEEDYICIERRINNRWSCISSHK